MRHIDASAARREFSRLYRDVAYGGERVVIDHHGQGLVALVPATDAERLAQLESGPLNSMSLPKLLEALRGIRGELDKTGVEHAGIFGSFARGTEHPGSDVDVLLVVRSGSAFSLFDLAGVRDRLIEVFGREVDVVTRRTNAQASTDVTRDAVYAF